MTSESISAPTRLRPRRTTRDTSAVVVTHRLGEAASAGVDRISGGRPLEELVVLASATTLVLGDMEHTDAPGLIVRGPERSTLVGFQIDATATFADAVRSVDAELRRGGDEHDPSEALVVRSDRVSADGPGGALTITLTGEPGRRELVGTASGHVEDWFVATVLRAVDATLAGFVNPRSAISEHSRVAADDVVTTSGFMTAGYDGTPVDETLVASIMRVVDTAPESIAIIDRTIEITYAQLWRQIEAVAARLTDAGVRPGDRVVVLGGKSANIVAAILGTQRCGAAYVPIDAKWPAPRVAAILADIDAAAILVDGSMRDRVADGAGSVPILDIATAVTPIAGVVAPIALPTLDQVAYIVYTSGSTGIPKGVIVRHAAIASYVRWKRAYHGLGADTRILQTASLAFDGGTSDLFSVLSAGGALVLADLYDNSPHGLADIAVRYGVTDVNTVPSMYRILLDELGRAASTLRLVTVGGEATSNELVRRHYQVLPQTRLVNEYGPTEASIAVTAFDHEVDAGPGFPIGKAIDNSVVSVSFSNGRLAPTGFVGELRLSGLGLADGYRDRPEQTADVFVEDAHAVDGRAYRSGDLGWWRPDGMLEFVGRVDSQVKIRGQRVEVGEVETALNNMDGVRAAAVVVTSGAEGEPVLVGFVEADNLSAVDVQTGAARVLAPAMVPTKVVVGDFPRSVSGKPDRAELERRASDALAERVDTASATSAADDVERAVGVIFGELFGTDECGPDADFFELGGHSLMALSAIGSIEERLQVLVDLDDFLSAGTVAGVAALVKASAPAPSDTTSGPVAMADGDVLGRLFDDLGAQS